MRDRKAGAFVLTVFVTLGCLTACANVNENNNVNKQESSYSISIDQQQNKKQENSQSKKLTLNDVNPKFISSRITKLST